VNLRCRFYVNYTRSPLVYLQNAHTVIGMEIIYSTENSGRLIWLDRKNGKATLVATSTDTVSTVNGRHYNERLISVTDGVAVFPSGAVDFTTGEPVTQDGPF